MNDVKQKEQKTENNVSQTKEEQYAPVTAERPNIIYLIFTGNKHIARGYLIMLISGHQHYFW